MARTPLAVKASATAVTPSDSVNFAPTRAVYVGGGGALHVLFEDGGDVTLSGIPAGRALDIAVTRVFATGTTATLITALR